MTSQFHNTLPNALPFTNQGTYSDTQRLFKLELARVHNNLAISYCFSGDYVKGRYEQEKAHNILEDTLPNDHRAIAESLHIKALLQSCSGAETAEINALYASARDIHHNVLDLYNAQDIKSLYSNALQHDVQGNYADAQRLYRLSSAQIHYRLAICNCMSGEFEKCRHQLRLLQEISADYKDERTIANSVYVEALLQSCAREETEQTEDLYKKALEIRQNLFGIFHEDTIISLCGLGIYYFNQLNYDDAERLYVIALKIRVDILGPNDASTAISYCHLGELYVKQGRYHDAEESLIQAQRIQELHVQPNNIDVAKTIYINATLLHHRGNIIEAMSLYRRALTIQKDVLGSHLLTEATLTQIGNCLLSLKRYNEAETPFKEALDIRINVLGDSHRETVLLRNVLANCFESQQKYDDAILMRSNDRIAKTYNIVFTKDARNI